MSAATSHPTIAEPHHAIAVFRARYKFHGAAYRAARNRRRLRKRAPFFRQRGAAKSSYLKLNAEGKVPKLLIDGRPLTEVSAILFYLARTYPDARLLPANDAEAEAQVMSWMSFIASTLHPARFRGAEHAKSVYAIADERLGDSEWAVGAYSIADIHLFRLYWRLCNALEFPAGQFPHLAAHHDRMMQRAAVLKTIAIEKALGYELTVWFP
jgi:glutathione S-transferase